jgi:GNAT superfamily N-acetyltransferase
MAEWHFEPLDRSHQRGEFCCGKAPLDEFLRTRVSQYDKRKLGRTYVAVRSDDKRVLGYYTLASSAIPFENLPPSASKKLPRHPVPVVLLARLAVDQSVQGQGLGRDLLIDAFRRCLDLETRIGVHAVEVDAIDDQARQFYVKYGFMALLDNELHLFLPISKIEKAFGG